MKADGRTRGTLLRGRDDALEAAQLAARAGAKALNRRATDVDEAEHQFHEAIMALGEARGFANALADLDGQS